MATVAVYVAKPPRPLGVSIIAILVMLGALLLLVTGALVLWGSSLYGLTDQFAFFQNATAAGITLLAVGILSFAVAFGLFAQRVWAWAVVIVLELIGLVTALYTFFAVGYPNWNSLVNVPIPAIVTIYLLLVRSSFV